MDNMKINEMIAAANGANHVGEYPASSYSPMPNKVGTIHAVCDLLEILETRAQLDNICLMHTEAVVKAEKLQALIDQVNSKAKFEFDIRATPKDPTGYYHPRWDNAYKISVIAEDKEQAKSIATAMLGKSSRGWPWAFSFDGIRQTAKAGEV